MKIFFQKSLILRFFNDKPSCFNSFYSNLVFFINRYKFNTGDIMEKKLRSGSGETRDSLNIFSDPKRRSLGFLSSESFVFLVLDCFSYTAGEKVTGEILFNISEHIPKSVLKFQSRGIEEIHIFDSKDRSKIIDEEIKEIFVLDTIMMEWETEIPIGQSVFPFNFKIPNYCPSTFYYSGEDANGFYVKAEVFYHVSVKLITSDCESSLSHSRIIIIKNNFALERPGPTVEATSDVIGCCYSNKGNTHFQLSVGNTDHCQVDGQIKYKLFLDNANCNASINHVIGNIILEFYVHTKKGQYKIIKNLSEVDRAT